eukprot:765761-Hanusia_phi.AAC.4
MHGEEVRTYWSWTSTRCSSSESSSTFPSPRRSPSSAYCAVLPVCLFQATMRATAIRQDRILLQGNRLL